MHILNADVLSSILFSWCKSKLANIISTEKLFVCLQFAYIGRFFFKTQIDQLPEEMYSMALAKNSLDDAVDLARTTRAMNISTTLKHW